MRLSDQTSTSRALQDRLEASRVRLDLARGFEGVSWSALAAAVTLGVLRVGELLAERWAFLDFLSVGVGWSAAGGVLLVGLAATAARMSRSRTSLLAIARRADHRFGLDERLSTAVEFGMLQASGESRHTASPVLTALFRDAAERGAQVSPQVLVPLSTPRPARYFAAVAVAILALEIALPGSHAGPEESRATPAAAAEDRAETVDFLLETAAMLRRDAESRSNDYLRVIATALESLALDIIEDRLSGDAMGEALARLAAHAELALRASEVQPGVDAGSTAVSGADGMAGEEGENQSAAAGDQDPEALSSGSGAIAQQVGGMLNEARAALQGLRSRLDDDSGDGERLAADTSPSSGVEGAMPEFDPSQMSGQEAVSGDGERALANLAVQGQTAPDASFGEGRSLQDGEGSAILAGAPEGTALPDAPSTRDFELPSEGGSRRRLPIEIVPETRFSSVSEQPLPQGDWRPGSEPRVSSDFLGLSHREIASRYFLSLTEEPPEAH